MAKNKFYGSGTIARVFENDYNGHVFYNVSVAFPDPARNREDGTPFTYNITVNVSGPMAERIKDRLKEGAKVLVEGAFEPSVSNGKRYYSVSASDFSFVDAGTMNHIVVQGRLTHDPEIRQTSNGTAVVSTSIAVDRNYRDKEGKWQTATSFVDVTAWGPVADQITSFSKGQAIWVIGKLTSRKYTDKNGTDHYPVGVTADTILSGGTGKYNQSADTPSKPEKADTPAESPEYGDYEDDGFYGYDEELPFD